MDGYYTYYTISFRCLVILISSHLTAPNCSASSSYGWP